MAYVSLPSELVSVPTVLGNNKSYCSFYRRALHVRNTHTDIEKTMMMTMTTMTTTTIARTYVLQIPGSDLAQQPRQFD